MKVSDNKKVFTLMHLVFLKLITHYCHLDFKLLHETKKHNYPKEEENVKDKVRNKTVLNRYNDYTITKQVKFIHTLTVQLQNSYNY